jgi:hypothetical protein
MYPSIRAELRVVGGSEDMVLADENRVVPPPAENLD